MKMADNFYTVLSNRVQEIWFDQGVELGGGEAFTVGEKGAERNRKYIVSVGFVWKPIKVVGQYIYYIPLIDNDRGKPGNTSIHSCRISVRTQRLFRLLTPNATSSGKIPSLESHVSSLQVFSKPLSNYYPRIWSILQNPQRTC